MKNKILIPVLILAALAAFFSFKYSGNEESPERKALVLQTVLQTIREGHFAPVSIDDSFSSRVFHKVLDNLDNERKFFTEKEVAELRKHEFTIDDEILRGETVFYDKLSELLSTSLNRASGIYTSRMKKPFDFTGSDSLQLRGDNLPFPANVRELEDRWHAYLTYRVLIKYVELKEEQDKAADSLGTARKTDAELEKQARQSVTNNLDRYFKRLKKLDDGQRFAIFVNAVTNSEDPHTDYMPPKIKQRFDEVMSGTFFGIGAQLREEDGKIMVAAIITGSPCWKQGELKANDQILKVAQGSEEPVDIQGYEIDDAVQLIRGKKGTEVRLTVKKVDGSTRVIPITRGEVLLEDVFAKSAVIMGSEGPVGYIYLPEFYSDFQQINGRRCAKDVAIELQKLKAAGVNGVILDLRHNGGGSLNDVVEMAGLFIDQGPIVQVKSKDAAPLVLRDRSAGILYDGPLAILVNEGSASASEILAAAMQDYGRAVVVGSTTFGKGTVQKIVSLDNFVDPLSRVRMKSAGVENLGSLKITIQKFYRVNGGSTQLKGVTPDITLPHIYSRINIGERRDKAALPWDEIAPADYTPVSNPVNIRELADRSRQRVERNEVFTLIGENAERIRAREESTAYSLNEAIYKKDMEEANALSARLEELEKQGTPYEITNLEDDLPRIRMDSSSIAKNEEWIKGIQKDIYISETVQIVNDMVKLPGGTRAVGAEIRKEPAFR